MQVKGKIFPYPVINNNKAFSNYDNKIFQISFEPQEDDKSYILKNCKFECDSSIINKLYIDGKIGIVLIIECSSTVYRKAFDVSNIEQDFFLKKVDFTEKVEVSMFAYAKESFTIRSDEFDEDYTNIDFEIEKYDIVGVNDGFNVRFRHEESEDNLVQSIFSVIPSDDLEPGKYLVECNLGRKITITLSKIDHNNYKIIYTVPAYKEVFFNMILIPSLIEGLSLCKAILVDDIKDIDDIENQYLWFRSITSAYKKLKGVELTKQDFKNISPVFLAQELLGKPFGQALKCLVEETNKMSEGGDENE